MSDPIVLDAISKCYRIYANPQDRLKQALADRGRRLLDIGITRQNYYREHWALRDIDLQLAEGESLGILGRNGAGKSTLLQIIAGTLGPTSGRVHIEGRVTALLELGSGFNPEFTGRENVFLNGAVLGLTRREVETRFDGIAAFADIGDFLEQPVKTYSSGMLMRLAFAVQTAVQPRILIIDEALSVGDMFFQAKCMIRLRELLDSGVSLLFVSHNVDTVRQICRRAVLLEGGRMIAQGSAQSVSDRYVSMQLDERNQRNAPPAAAPLPRANAAVTAVLPESPAPEASPEKESALALSVAFASRTHPNRTGNGKARILDIEMLRNGKPAREFEFDEEVTIRFSIRICADLPTLNQAIWISTLQGTKVLYQDTRLQDLMAHNYQAGEQYVFHWTLRLPLMHGAYTLGGGLTLPPVTGATDWEFFDVIPLADEFRMYQRRAGMIGGLVAPMAQLTRQRVTAQETPHHSVDIAGS